MVLASEKKISSILIDDDWFHKIYNLSDNLGISYSGLTPDFQSLLKKGRKDNQKYYAKFEIPMNSLQMAR